MATYAQLAVRPLIQISAFAARRKNKIPGLIFPPLSALAADHHYSRANSHKRKRIATAIAKITTAIAMTGKVFMAARIFPAELASKPTSAFPPYDSNHNKARHKHDKDNGR